MSSIAVNAITDANAGNTATINSVTPNVNNVVGKNRIINGNFDFWQRGTTASYSSTVNQYLADRWLMRTTSTTNATTSQQSFTVGQTDVPNNPKYFYRWDTTSYTAGNGVLEQRIEDVSTFAGNTCTLSFWAKCNTAQTLNNSYLQVFGTGGSATVATETGSPFSLTTAWQKFTVAVTLPSISGKTIAGGDDYLALRFTMPAAVCTVDIAQVQLEAGSSATEFEHRPYGMELSLCQRYLPAFVSSSTNSTLPGIATALGTNVNFIFNHPVPARVKGTGVTVSGATHFNFSNNDGNSSSTAVSFGAGSSNATQLVITVAVSRGPTTTPGWIFSNTASGLLLITGCEL
jgi:hypothetical protein